MPPNSNLNPAPSQTRYKPQIIEGLKAAGEELRKSPPKFDEKAKPSFIPKKREKEVSPKPVPEKIDLLKKLEECQKELTQEQSILEKRYQEVQGLEKKLSERIGLLKKLQARGVEINKQLEEFQAELSLIKKENRGLLEEIKIKLGEKDIPSINSEP